MKNYVVFKIQGDSNIIEPIGKIMATSAQEAIKAIYNKYKNDWFDKDFGFNKSWKFEDALNEGGTTGGEDSAILGYLPAMEDCWLITSETEYAVLAVEELELFSALMQSIRDMKKLL